ncbi:MAG: FxDxF family PEP-CTERM protein [Pseudomonadota bacterium]|nr:FxDxF family PEP-CTERM protein [Pseudomonadota bacterium]
MNLLKKIALAASLALVSNFAAAANYSFGDVETGVVDSTGSFDLQFDFVDITSVDWLVDSVVMNFDVATFTTHELTLSVFDGFGAELFSDTKAVNVNSDVLQLDVGSYATVTGTGFSEGSTWNVIAIAAPVPEPSTYALMLAGLGLVGFMARRRKAA